MNVTFLLNNLGNSDLTYNCLNLVSELSSDNTVSTGIIYKNLLPQLSKPKCITMNISALSYINGNVIAMDLETADILMKNRSNTTNYLYLWNIDWLYDVINYDTALNILHSFKLIARSERHKEIITNFSGIQDIRVVNDFDKKELMSCLI
jgi:hypothetical protein